MPTKTVAGPCTSVAAAAGFVNIPLTAASRVMVADVTATPSVADSHVVHGLANGSADAYGDLTVAFRFARSGVLEARDGDTYRADAVLAYEAGTSIDIRIIADLASRTYSMMTSDVVIARNYRMLGDAAQLDTLATIAESGAVDICGASEAPEVLFQRPGAHAVIADANVISDGSTTTRIGESGETLASFARGGELAADAAGNIYIARVTGTTLAVDSLSPSFAIRWSRTYDAPFGSQPSTVATTSAGDVMILLAHNNMLTLRALAGDGTPRWTRDLNAVAAVPNAAGFALARTSERSVTVEQFDRDGNPQWSRMWRNDVSVDEIASSPAGQIVFGGRYHGTIDFGGAAIDARPPGQNGPLDAYVVALSPTGEHVFSQRLGEAYVSAIATNGTHTIVAAEHSIGPLLTTRYTLDQTGEVLDWREGLAGFGWFGPTYRLAVSSAGRVFWSYGPAWPDDFTARPQLVAY